jgi:U3 small nucleolar RNA-associated protein 14
LLIQLELLELEEDLHQKKQDEVVPIDERMTTRRKNNSAKYAKILSRKVQEIIQDEAVNEPPKIEVWNKLFEFANMSLH